MGAIAGIGVRSVGHDVFTNSFKQLFLTAILWFRWRRILVAKGME